MTIRIRSVCTAAFIVTGMLAAGATLADKPGWAGGGEKGKAAREHRDAAGPQERRGEASGRGAHFRDEHRTAVRGYYESEYRAGKCPPGLAKKRNGCMPPGQARKWQIGRPLPPGVIYYDVPPPLLTRLGPPPPGYRYVRVASDILLIALGTGMVMDAIQDLGRM